MDLMWQARGRWRSRRSGAMGDTLGIVEAVRGKSRPLWSRFFSAFWVKVGLKVAPYLLPYRLRLTCVCTLRK